MAIHSTDQSDTAENSWGIEIFHVNMPEHNHGKNWMRYSVKPIDIERIVGEYYKEFRDMADFAPVIKGPFEIDSLEEEELYRKSGCYLIYDSDGNLRYIGMSESNMLNRVKKHCSDSVKKSAFWINNLPHSVQIIETSASWEAPMIEAYLTHHAKVDK